MKILFISEFFPQGKNLKFSGGVESRTFNIARILAKKHEVTVITCRIANAKKSERIFGLQIFRVGKPSTYQATTGAIIHRLFFVKEAIRFSKTLDFDLVEGTNFITHFIAKRAAVIKRKPVVVWYPDVWVGRWITITGFGGILGEVLERFNLLNKFDSYIAISKEVYNKLKIRNLKPLYLIPCGVDSNEFKGSVTKSKTPQIICISRLTKYKNVKTLILAFANLSLKIKKAKLLIVGSGPQLYKLKKLTEELKISNKVRFLSNITRKDLISNLKLSHVFSLPSLIEGFGISTIEAASAGLPYVLSDISVHREVTKKGLGGYLVNPKSPLEFSEKIETLLTNKETYKKKSSEAKRLSRHYDWDKIAQTTEKVYKRLT